MLGGAFDATARVAHHVGGLTTSPRSASWANDDWRGKLASRRGPLASLMAPGQPARDARELVAVLRNTIHSQAMRIVGYQPSGGPHEELVVVPRSLEAEFEKLVQRQPTAAAFAIDRLPSGHLYLDPGSYVEALFPRALDALNQIMDETPIEDLAGVDLSRLLISPPSEDRHDNIFHPAVRRRLRLLAGFAQDTPTSTRESS
jgi:hypothetical protein